MIRYDWHQRVQFSVGVALMSLVLFTALAYAVLHGWTLPFDQAVLTTLYAHSTATLDAIFQVGTNLGGIIGVLAIGVGLTALLAVRRQYRRALLVIGTLGLAMALNVVLKLCFERPRPDLWEQLIIETSFSFPSGHATASSALALSLIVICWRTRWRVVALIVGLSYMAFIALSRLYLGVHYPSDILGGWLTSIFALSVVYSALIAWGDKSHTLGNNKSNE